MSLTPRERVLAWVDDNFCRASVEIKEWGILPGGMMLRDKNGDGETMYVFLDVLYDKVTYRFADADE